MSLILLLAAVVVAVLSGFALHAVRGLRREVAGLRGDLDRRAAREAAVPAARPAPVAEDVRVAVADALAAERERELAEARAFWDAQDGRDADTFGGHADTFGAPYGPGTYDALPDLHPGYPTDPHPDLPLDYDVSALDAALLDALLDEVTAAPEVPQAGPVVPRQADRRVEATPVAEPEGTGERAEPEPAEAAAHAEAPHAEPASRTDRTDAEAAARAAARRRHPSNPHHTLSGEPVVPAPASGAEADDAAPDAAALDAAARHAEARQTGGTDAEGTVARLAAVAASGTELTDVRPGPLGTLDVYVFADGTTVCLSPGHRDTAERLAGSLRAGDAPVLLGGSGISGGYALTFACGEETLYVLADRVIASR
ncbi:hypothetical protein [Streptomyces sp. JJ66]|uniref:hypothetical protein n=1 Tax=Streptomyces sp. JJ66 TaxID=2803843 RepID=UPI0035B0749B